MIKIPLAKTLHVSYYHSGSETPYGLFELEDGTLYTNLTHGGTSGKVWIEETAGVKTLVRNTDNFRKLLFMLMDVEDTGQALLINPCYPIAVSRANEEAFAKQEVYVLAGEEDKIGRVWFNKNTNTIYMDYRQTLSRKVRDQQYGTWDALEAQVERTVTTAKKAQRITNFGSKFR